MALDLNLFTSPFVAAYRKRAVTSHSCEHTQCIVGDIPSPNTPWTCEKAVSH